MATVLSFCSELALGNIDHNKKSQLFFLSGTNDRPFSIFLNGISYIVSLEVWLNLIPNRRSRQGGSLRKHLQR